MGIEEAFHSAMRALVAIDEPLPRRIADAYLCLFCWGAIHDHDGNIPVGVGEWLADVRARIASVDADCPLSSRIRRWADALSASEARGAALQIVDAFREITLASSS
jgi:hypothetical protein